MKHRVCYGCKHEYPLSQFQNWANGREGKAIRCKECMREWHKQNSERVKAIYHANKGQVRSYRKKDE